MIRGRRWSGWLVACALGCETSPAIPGESTTTADSAGTSSTSGTSEGTTFAGPRTCAATSECDAGFCVAPYDAGAGTGSAGMGTPACVPECVPADALDRWCIDDAACCEGLSCDARDGFCVAPAASSDDTIGESWSTGGSSEGSSTTSGATSEGASSSDS